jgi:DNA-binding CsgD family transcriptional regulator
MDLSKLSHDEIQTLKLFKKGYSNKQIGKTLGISEKGVRWRMTSVYKKLNVIGDGQTFHHKGKLLLVKLLDCKEL